MSVPPRSCGPASKLATFDANITPATRGCRLPSTPRPAGPPYCLKQTQNTSRRNTKALVRSRTCVRPQSARLGGPGVASSPSCASRSLAREVLLVQFATLAHGARGGRVRADAEVEQRDGSPGTRCRSACASEHLVDATVRSAADRATRQCQHRRAARSQCLAKSRAGAAAALAASGR